VDLSRDDGGAVELSVRVQAASGPEVVGAARAMVRTVLELWDCDDPEGAGALLTSELVTNALRHAAGVLALQIELSLLEGVVRVSVEDSAPARPMVQARSRDATGGRGLQLVEALAAQWGSTPTDRGKAVWFEFPIRRRDPDEAPPADRS
jgi:anti-sigma regulatory factor (Ser/Thr protein kinase)